MTNTQLVDALREQLRSDEAFLVACRDEAEAMEHRYNTRLIAVRRALSELGDSPPPPEEPTTMTPSDGELYRWLKDTTHPENLRKLFNGCPLLEKDAPKDGTSKKRGSHWSDSLPAGAVLGIHN